MDAVLVADEMIAGRRDGSRAAVARRRPDRLARDEIDDAPGVIIELADQQIDPVEQIVVRGDRNDGDGETERRGDTAPG